MPQDKERIARLADAMNSGGFDAIAVSLPENILLLTGYYPVVGTSVAIATRDGEVMLFVPEDEMDLAAGSGASETIAFRPASMERLIDAVDALREPLARVLKEKGLSQAVIACEEGAACEPASYAAMHLYGSALAGLLGGAHLRSAAELLVRMKSVLTPMEIERVRRSCRIAALAFAEGRAEMAVGMKETEAAAGFRRPLFEAGVGFEGAERAEGYAFCMSGANSARAFGAYARSRPEPIRDGDFVLTHCNSHADGYWTDVTRTYCLGHPDARKTKIYEAVFEARRAALECVRPGVQACEVDGAAREVMRARGFGENFKHATGHGVGFHAIDHAARPCIHPRSAERLETGMVFNIEPAAYFEGYGGVRHCDMVAVTPSGAKLLTPFQCEIEAAIVLG